MNDQDQRTAAGGVGSLPRWTVTGALAAVTTAVSIALSLTGYEAEAAFGLGFIPARVQGAILPPEVSALPVWLTPIGATLVHLGPLNLLFSVAMLLLVGFKVEQALGPRALIGLYIGGAYVAALAYLVEAPMAILPEVGAFDAASAITGAYVMLYSRVKDGSTRLPDLLIHAAMLTLVWAVLNIGMSISSEGAGLVPGWTSPIAAFVLGLALARPLLAWRYRGA